MSQSDFIIENGVLTQYIGNDKNVIIPDGVTELSDYVFSRNTMETITIPSSITSIGKRTFFECHKLVSVNGSDNVKFIGYGAFADCDSLTSINIPENAIIENAFKQCKGLVDENGFVIVNNILFDYLGEADCVEIPNGVTVISEDAFTCNHMTSIKIPDSVISIIDGAFYGCDSLKTIIIPDSVTTLGNEVFSDCSNLETVILSANLTTIGDKVFYGCSSLTAIKLSKGVTAIGHDAFCNCTSLRSVEIPESVAIIGNDAFFACEELTINAPKGSFAELYAKMYKIKFMAI